MVFNMYLMLAYCFFFLAVDPNMTALIFSNPLLIECCTRLLLLNLLQVFCFISPQAVRLLGPGK